MAGHSNQYARKPGRHHVTEQPGAGPGSLLAQAIRPSSRPAPVEVADALAMLARDLDIDIRRAAARHPACPLHALDLLRDDSDPETCAWVASNPRCQPEWLRQLAQHPNPNVRWQAASNPNVPPDLLRQLGLSDDWSVARAAFGNPAALPETLQIWAQHIARDTDYQPFGPICSNRKSWAGTWSQFPSHFRISTRLLAGHLNTPPPMLGAVGLYEQQTVRVRGVGNFQLDTVREIAIRNPSFPPGLLDGLSQDPQIPIRMAVASNPNCPPAAMRRLARSTARSMATTLADNPGLPPDLFEKLLRHPDRQVAQAAAANPGCPPHLRVLWQLAHDEAGTG
jgi:hypothetical protein